MKKTILLFDLDHTLLDFALSEKQGLSNCFEAFHLSFNQEIEDWYVTHNLLLWDAYAKGEIPRNEIFKIRFSNTLAHFHLHGDGLAMEAYYRQQLDQGSHLIPYALEVVEHLSKTASLYALTNGIASTQEKRLLASGLQPFFKNMFVSETTGFQKPMKEYFHYCFEKIPNFEKKKALMIGDSLLADIKGGHDSGVDTCWFSPSKEKNNTEIQPTYEIHCLKELYTLLQ